MKLGQTIVLIGSAILILSIWYHELRPIGIIVGLFGLGVMLALGMAEIENPPKHCRKCGTTDNLAITYEKDGVCRKCLDEVLPLITKDK